MFDADLAEVYDLVYRGRGQDFRAEAELVTRVVRTRRPGAVSLLDVGCGTGEHLSALRACFDHVEGLDRSESMIAVARAKLPGVRVHAGDMCDFDLGRRYDAVISLSSAVAYLPSAQAMRTAVARMAAHLVPGGVLVVEPWYFPEAYVEGHIAGDVLRENGRTVSRVSRAERDGEFVRVDSHYLVADRQSIRHFTERQTFGLWRRELYERALRDAGCSTEYIEGVQSRRGLFIGRLTRRAVAPHAGAP
ncbi:Methyltransferase domain-containing protein [Thermomonospora echinospora]|uniref:Methyltransferase domain-containing protein n=1 Tax=Thermomonospora echinospora TaxID=1992 RepID=A0A1H5TV49_9ACTN|nr:class I SAM-dependent methyltransferase [Thermomonospora echinospora]SEF66674.1 Methyltransferase domain-containing protein [Thermomonospora echinospora]